MNSLKELNELKKLDNLDNLKTNDVHRFLFELDGNHSSAKPLDIPLPDIQKLATAEDVATFSRGFGYSFSAEDWLKEVAKLKKLKEVRAMDQASYQHEKGSKFLGALRVADYIFKGLEKFNPNSF